MSRVETKLLQMPLKYLSNTENDYFTLNNAEGVFELKEEVIPFWAQPEFRKLIKDRVDFALKRYFYRRLEKPDFSANN